MNTFQKFLDDWRNHNESVLETATQANSPQDHGQILEVNRLMNSENQSLIIGTRVHCVLHGGRDGVIFEIHGKQSPATCGSIGDGFMVTGGSALFDIVWKNGTQSLRTPETLLQRSSQWSILPGLATLEEIQSMLGSAILETHRREDERTEKQQKFDAAVLALRSNSKYSHLKQTSPVSMGSHTLAASNIRAELKKAFPGVKFSVTSKSFAGGNSIDVRWTDGPIISAVDKIIDIYSGGTFDGMTDCYNYSSSAWTTVFGSSKYIHSSRSHTVDAMKEAVREVCLEYGWPLIKVEVSSYDGRGYLSNNNLDACRIVHDFLEKRNQYAEPETSAA